MTDKRLWRLVSLVATFAVLIVAVTMLACRDGGDEPEDGTESDATDGKTISLVRDGECVYTVLRGEMADADEVTAASKLNRAIKDATGLNSVIGTDWEDGNDYTGRAEILVGQTNRPETAAALEGLDYFDYIIKIDGNKIVICGGSAQATVHAAEYFKEQYLTADGSALPDIPADLCLLYKREDNLMARYVDKTRDYTSRVLTVLTNPSGADRDYIYANSAAATGDIRFVDGSAELIYRIDISKMLQPTVTLSLRQAYVVEIAEIPGEYTEVLNSESGAQTVMFTVNPYEHGIYDTLYIRLTDPTPEDGGGAAISSFVVSYFEEGLDKTNPYFLDADMKERITQLSGDLPASEVDGYDIHADGGMIYNPISREKADTLTKYDGAECFTGELKAGDATLVYSIPKNVTAYDAVPVKYTLVSGSRVSSSSPVHFSATAQEDKERGNGELYYDLNLPGRVDVTFNYEGYVSGTADSAAKPNRSLDFKGDTEAEVFPDYSVSELIRSGTVRGNNYTWFKFTYTNTGNTVLDGDGNGTFCFEPILYKKNGSSYTQVATIDNLYYRIVDELYPGESGTLWVIFSYMNGAAPGDYYMAINGLVRNEIDDPGNFGRTIWGGEIMTRSELYFTISDAGDNTPVTSPSEMKKTTASTVHRNRWLHTYEEFQSSYNSFLSLGAGVESSGTLWLQPSPWSNQVVLKLIIGDTASFDAVSLPVSVESDSLEIVFNPDNNNYVVREDGTRYPAIVTQSMADMRVNISQSPDTAGDIVRYLAEMKDLGINVVNTTAGFAYDNGVGGTSFAFSLDVLRMLGMRLEGFISYPYTSSGIIPIAERITGEALPGGGIGSAEHAVANGILAEYQFLRWGDNYWTVDGEIVLSAEDTRGGTAIVTDSSNLTDARDDIGSQSKANFIVYCQSLYGDIDALNSAWGSAYESFYDIDPEADGDNFGKKGVFGGWSRAVIDLDCFRTLERVYSYGTLTESISDTVPKAVLDLRLEGSHWLASVEPDSKSAHFRHVYYDQRANAIIPELLGTDGFVKYVSVYIWDAYTPSEVSFLTEGSVENGITPAMLPLFNRMRDVAINSKYGKDYRHQYNLTGDDRRGVQINTTVSLYEWWKATYEAGGVPGILWSDYLCDGYATATQRREIAFFVGKLNEALNSEVGRAWSTDFENDDSALEGSNGVFSYSEDFVRAQIDAYYGK